MHPEEIKAALRIKGMTLTVLAEGLGLSRSMVTQVIYGYSRSRRVESRICEVLGKPASAIWTARKPTLRRKKTTAQAVRSPALRRDKTGDKATAPIAGGGQ